MSTSAVAFAAVVVVFGCTRKESPSSDVPGLLTVTTASAALPPPVPSASTPQQQNADEPAAAVETAERPMESTKPRFVGRWVPDGKGMRCSWSGSYMVGRFKGTGVAVRIRDEGANLFQVVVDGEVKKVLRTDKAKGETVYPLIDGLPDAVHDVSLHRRTEARVGEAVVFGFEPIQGTALPPPPAPERRIELIGDSITTGYGNEGPGATCTYVNSQQNEYETYGAITARNLGADHVTVAWSGKTIYEMREYFDKALPQRPDGPRWDFAR
ncbi:MAG TPA: hypothetical protein VM580_14720, partial [Labilithrix sp.]|nr:hypothetical protein [Labilithrix sp.]